MNAIQIMYRSTALLIASVFLLVSAVLPVAHAGMIGTDTFASAEYADSQRQDIIAMLERDQVREQLQAWGVDPANAEQRVGSMTSAEVQELHDRMQEMPAGGSVVGALVFVFLVLLATDILGYTDVFPFTKSQAR